METPISIFMLSIWAIAVSWIEERSGYFNRLSPSWKQAVNSVISAIVPALVVWSSGVWNPRLGSPVEFFGAILFLLVPWLISQIAHYVDLFLAKQVA